MQLWMLKSVISALFPIRHLFNTSQTSLSLRACGSNAAVTFFPPQNRRNRPALAMRSVTTLAPYICPFVALSWHSIGERENHKRKPCNTVKGRVMLYYLTPDSRSDVFSLYRKTCGMLTEIKKGIVYRLRKAETGALLVQPDTC